MDDRAALTVAGGGALARPETNPCTVYLASLAPGSRRAMGQALRAALAILTDGGETDPLAARWEDLGHAHVAALRVKLAEKYSPAMANKVLSAVRGVLREAWRLGAIDGEVYRQAVDVPPVRGERVPKGRAPTVGELVALFAACAGDEGPAGRRDAAMLAVLYGAGLRRGEVTKLDLSDYNPENGALTVRGAKGNKDRTTYATDGSRDALTAWIAVRGQGPGALFTRIGKGAKLTIERLDPQSVLFVLAKRCNEAGVKVLAPHDMRRGFASDLLDRGADISTVQRLMGHASVTTTQRYDRRGEETKRRAVELLHVPFAG